VTVREVPPKALPRGRLLWRLLTYHVLILLGGALMIDAVVNGTTPLLWPGLVILVVGVLIAIVAATWAAGLTVRAGAARRRSSTDPEPSPGAPSAPGWFCPRCARAGSGHRVVCPRCGALVVRAGAT
jgi:hypothetical protein